MKQERDGRVRCSAWLGDPAHDIWFDVKIGNITTDDAGRITETVAASEAVHLTVLMPEMLLGCREELHHLLDAALDGIEVSMRARSPNDPSSATAGKETHE